MKRIIALLAAILMLFAFGCGQKTAPEKELPDEAETAAPTAEPTAEPTPEPTAEPTEEPQPTESLEDDALWKTVELEQYTEESGEERITITALIPDGATLLIELPGQADYTYTNTKGELTRRKIHIPVEVFFPNVPLDTAEAEIAPHVTITTADGTEHEIECPFFTYTFPTLSIEITSAFEAGEDGGILVKAGKNGVYRLTFKLNDADALAMIDGAALAANGDGVYTWELSVSDGLPTVYELTANKMNCVSASLSITVEP